MNKSPANKQAPVAPVAFYLTNCDAKAANFIGSVVKMFTDPAFGNKVQFLRNGTLIIRMNPKTGFSEVCNDNGAEFNTEAVGRN